MRPLLVVASCVAVPAVAGVAVGVLGTRDPEPPDVDAYLGTSEPLPIPRVGRRVVLPTVDAFGRSLPKRGEVLLVEAGNCYVCSTRRWDPRRLLPLSKRRAVIVYWTNPEQVKNLDYLKSHAYVLFDPKQVLLPSEFNYRSPVGYVVDVGRSRLAGVQREGDGILAFVRRS